VTFVFVGERRSVTAIEKNWTWHDGRLAAVPLFEALRALDIDPTAQTFVNLWTDPPGEPELDLAVVDFLRRTDQTVCALGARVARQLARSDVAHIALVHPAARGRIRKRSRYLAHVNAKLGRIYTSQRNAP